MRYADDNCKRLLGVIPADVSPPMRWGPSGRSDVDQTLPSGWKIPRKYLLHSVGVALPLDASLKGRPEKLETERVWL